MQQIDEQTDKRKKLVYGVGIYDSYEKVKGNRCYIVWGSMIERCFSQRWKQLHPTYADCSMWEGWKNYSVFKKWFDENYVKGYDLDKDLLSRGAKVYSPETCVFLPPEINRAILCKGKNNGLKIGVRKYKDRYKAYINMGYTRDLGMFDTEDDAHDAYVIAKRRHIKTLAKYYFSRGGINQKIYDALLNFPIPEY